MNRNTFSSFCSSMFIRLFMTDIGCFLLSFFIISISSNSLVRALIQIINILIITAVVYSLARDRGTRDIVLIESGHKKRSLLKGFWVGLIATSPFLLSGIVLLVSRIFGVPANFIGYYKMINAFFFPFHYSVMPADLTIMEIAWSDILLSLSTLLVIPILSMLSYWIGLSKFSFNEVVFYKKTKE